MILGWTVRIHPDWCIIVTTGRKADPWYSVWADRDEGPRPYATRYGMALDLAGALNGREPLPRWLADMDRVRIDKVLGADGSYILALGPIDESWRERDDIEAKTLRARAIDFLGCRAYPEADAIP